MIVIDSNILIYAYDPESESHRKASAWLSRVFSGLEPVGLPWSSIHTFLRLTTNPRLYPRALGGKEAADIVEAWNAAPAVRLIQPGEYYWSILKRFLSTAQIRGNLVMDAHLAALAIENGATLCTTDKDFSRFDGLRVINPLA